MKGKRQLDLVENIIKSEDLGLGYYLLIGTLFMDRGPMEIDSTKVMDTIDTMIKGLSAADRKVIQMRYGLNNGNTMTLQQVGDKFKVSRERIRQLEERGLKKMKTSNKVGNLLRHITFKSF